MKVHLCKTVEVLILCHVRVADALPCIVTVEFSFCFLKEKIVLAWRHSAVLFSSVKTENGPLCLRLLTKQYGMEDKLFFF